MSYINDTSTDNMDTETTEVTQLNSTLNEHSMNRSGTIRSEEVTAEQKVPRPEIRKVRNFTEEIKSACAKTSSSCGISVDKARIAVQVVCNELYHHKYYLSKEEQLSSGDVNEIPTTEPRAKRARSTTNSNAPKSSSDYEIYKYVLPSAKIIRNYKNLQATQEETNAGVKLFEKCLEEKVTLHFDTTSRCNIDGEWPAIILNFSSNIRFNLRPLLLLMKIVKILLI